MEKNIFLVDVGVDLSLLKTKIHEFPDSIIFTLDYEIHKILEKNHILHEIGENILTKEDFDEIDSCVIDLTDHCFENNVKELTIKNVFLPELIKHELFQYLLIQFLKPFVISKIIKNHKINTIFDFTNYSDFIKKLIFDLNIEYFSFLNNSNSALYHDKIKFTMNIFNFPLHLELSRNSFLKIKKLSQKIINFLYNLEPKINISKNIMLINFDPLEYGELLMELNRQNVPHFLLNTRKPAITNKKSLNVIKESNTKILDLNKFNNSTKNEILSEKIKLEESISKIFNEEDIFRNSFSIHNISFWSCIKTSFQKICTMRFNESVERILLLTKLFNFYDISSIFVWIDVGQEEKECILVGKNFSITSIMLQHGRFQTSQIWNKFAKFLGQFPAPMLSDKQIVWGKITKQYALSHNHNENDILIGGSPRHDKFSNFSSSKNENGIILLATTGTMFLSTDSCVTNSQIKYDDYIKEICRIVKSIPGKKLVIKSHPSQILRKFVKDIVDEMDSSIPIIENMTNQELFNSCELLITFNNSTTALEAISLGTPVISLQTEIWAKEDDIAQSNAIVSVDNINDCENAVKKILFNEEFKNELIKNGTIFLNNYMENFGFASKTVANILKNFSEKN